MADRSSDSRPTKSRALARYRSTLGFQVWSAKPRWSGSVVLEDAVVPRDYRSLDSTGPSGRTPTDARRKPRNGAANGVQGGGRGFAVGARRGERDASSRKIRPRIEVIRPYIVAEGPPEPSRPCTGSVSYGFSRTRDADRAAPLQAAWATLTRTVLPLRLALVRIERSYGIDSGGGSRLTAPGLDQANLRTSPVY